MSLKSSGLWCDLCGNPILSGVYWHISFKRMNGDNKKGHACEKCRKERVFPHIKKKEGESDG